MSDPLITRPHLAEGLTPPRPRGPFHSSSTFASLMLLGLTAFWGLSFSLMKSFQGAADAVPVPASSIFGSTLLVALSTIVLRTGLAVPLVVLARPRFLIRPTRGAHARGAILGMVFSVAFTFGVCGLSVISPARSAFLINLTCVFVPLLGWLAFGTRPSRLLVAGLAVCLAGVAVLTGNAVGAEQAGVNWGDAVTVVSAALFAVQVILLDHFGRTHRSQDFTFMFLATTALVSGTALILGMLAGDGLLAWATWLRRVIAEPDVPAVVLGMAITTALSLSLMSTYQPRVGANRAALIYLMEIVFSALFGIAFGYDELTWALVASGSLIIIGNLVVEAPALLKGKSDAAGRTARRLFVRRATRDPKEIDNHDSETGPHTTPNS